MAEPLQGEVGRRVGRDTPDHRGHLFDRSVDNNTPVLRCRYGDCGFVWWPDERRPSKPCKSEMAVPIWPESCGGGPSCHPATCPGAAP